MNVLIVGLVLWSVTMHGADIVATSCSTSHVQTAINSASDGDAVLIPNGSCTWTSNITTTKQIVIRAQNYTPTSGGDTARNVTITNNYSPGNQNCLLNITSGNAYHVRVSGIKFAEGSGDGGAICVLGSGTKVVLVDDCWIEFKSRAWPDGWPIKWSAIGGVLWNMRFVGLDQGAAGTGAAGGSFHVSSNRAWNTDHTMGSADTDGDVNLYVEDSTCLNVSQFPDNDDNARFVMRYTYLDGCWGTTHGFTSTWGGRHVEYYNNTFAVTNQDRNIAARYYWMRAGTGSFTDNVVNDASFPSEYGSPALLDTAIEGSLGTYPMPRQVGRGYSGGDISDPVYIWNNTGAKGSSWNTSDPSHIQLNRDIFVDDGAKAGYSKYTYPHPLRSAAPASVPAKSPGGARHGGGAKIGDE